MLDDIEAVGVGVFGIEMHVYRRQQRIFLVAEPLQEVLAEVVAQAADGLLLGDVFRRFHGGHSVKFLLQLDDAGLLDVAVHHNLETDVFAEMVGEFLRVHHKQGKYA